MNTELFDLKVGYVKLKNPIALAPMGGVTDSSFVNNHAKEAGLVTIGGYNIDESTKKAADDMILRGRKEFVLQNPLMDIEEEISKIKCDCAVSVNVRSSTLTPLVELAQTIKDKGCILEIDAHCRQKEIIDAGAGEALLHDLQELARWIKRIKETGVVLSVKIRTGIIDDITLAKEIERAGADIVHVDAMIAGNGADLDAIRKIRDSTGLFLIGNNSITGFSYAKDMFSRGADVISVAREVLDNSSLIRELVYEISNYQKQCGWYNAPKHLCSGKGDLRGLSFCCVPVKPCALMYKIKQIGLSPQEFSDIKNKFAKGTMLEYGDSTCFGSLVWCCKITKPCFLRDGVLEMLQVNDQEYMLLKKELADYILENSKVATDEN